MKSTFWTLKSNRLTMARLGGSPAIKPRGVTEGAPHGLQIITVDGAVRVQHTLAPSLQAKHTMSPGLIWLIYVDICWSVWCLGGFFWSCYEILCVSLFITDQPVTYQTKLILPSLMTVEKKARFYTQTKSDPIRATSRNFWSLLATALYPFTFN